MATVSASQARQTLPAQLDRVEAGEEVAITRHGKVVAMLVPPRPARTARAAAMWAEADRLRERLEQARHEPLLPPSISVERADEIVQWIREGRDSR